MRRRETIIIAVLVNAALLLVLFATAMRSDSKKSKDESIAEKQEVAEGQAVAAAVPTDDVVMEILGGEEVELAAVDPSETTTAASVANAPIGAAGGQVVAPNTASAPSVQTPMAATVTSRTQVVAPSSGVSVTTPSAPAASGPVAVTQNTTVVAPTVIDVIVKKGDALVKIARAHKTTVAEIMRESGISSTQLKIGQRLKVPTNTTGAAVTVATKSSSPTPATVSAAVQSGEDFYVVKEGDNPWLIANRLGLKLEELLRLNSMDDSKAKKLRPGDRLRIR